MYMNEVDKIASSHVTSVECSSVEMSLACYRV